MVHIANRHDDIKVADSGGFLWFQWKPLFSSTRMRSDRRPSTADVVNCNAHGCAVSAIDILIDPEGILEN